MSAQKGFTLVELMVVVVVIGVLAAIGIANFSSLQARAHEASVKSNMHSVQMALEDFSVQNNSYYPTAVDDALPDGRTLQQICPSGDFPENPFTRAPTVIQFNADPTPGNAGELGVNPANTTAYLLKGNGPAGAPLSLVLTTGQ